MVQRFDLAIIGGSFAGLACARSAALMTAPMRRLAQRLYFHTRGESAESFEAWSQAFEHGEAEAKTLKLV
jgi:hypothetical protein